MVGKYIRVNKGKAFINKIGVKAHMLTVVKEIGYLDKDNCKEKKIHWLCECECGGSVIIAGCKIGRQKSCGCLKKTYLHKSKKNVNWHGESKLPEYKTWCTIRARCNRPSHVKYKSYGGRGITVCERWMDNYMNFLEDMGRKPSPNHSIDRINVNGNYEPSNCRWATSKEQSYNKTTTVRINYDGREYCMKELSIELGCKYHRLQELFVIQKKTIEDIINNNLLYL